MLFLRFAVLICACLFPSLASAEHDTLYDYRCWQGDTRELYDGACLPSPTTHFDMNGRTAMYIRCRAVKGGRDEYTANCCEHLRDSDASALKVCRGRTNPESGLGLILQFYTLTGPTRWVCNVVDCQLIGRAIGVPFL
jgi:hypothetical protein